MRSFAILIAIVPAVLAATNGAAAALTPTAPPVTMSWLTDAVKAQGEGSSTSMDASMSSMMSKMGGKMTMTMSGDMAMSTGNSMESGKAMSTMSMTGKATGTGSPAMATTNAASPAVAGVGIAGAAMVVGGLLMGSL